MPSGMLEVMKLDEKKRKTAIAAAAVLGLIALLYLGGFLGQALENYELWMASDGMWDQEPIAAPNWNPLICFWQAFSLHGLKAMLLILLLAAGIVLYLKFHDNHSWSWHAAAGFAE